MKSVAPSTILRSSRTGRPLMLATLLGVVTLAAFWPLVHNDFIAYDDKAYVWHNARVLGGLTWSNVVWAFRAGYQANWHPLTWLSHMLDVQLFGLKPGWHHFESLLFHTGNALLLFALLRRLTGTEWRSFFVAALFAVHPLHVESVAWVAERKDVLSTFFFLLTLLAYVKAAEDREQRAGDREQKLEANPHVSRFTPGASRNPGRNLNRNLFDWRGLRLRLRPGLRSRPSVSPYYILALFCFALGLMSKPMLVTLPFLLLLLDYWPLGRFQPPTATEQLSSPANEQFSPPQLKTKNLKLKTLSLLVLEKVPFLALSALSIWLTWLAQTRGHGTYLHLPLTARLANAIASYWTYLGQTFWPARLAIFYPHPALRFPSDQWPAWQIGGATAGLTLISFWVLRRLERAPWLAIGWFWYLGTLVPVIGLVQAGAQARADRYTYIPLIGVFICLVWEAARMLEFVTMKPGEPGDRNQSPFDAPLQGMSRLGCGSTALRRFPGFGIGVVAGLVAVLACAVQTHRQTQYWRNNRTLFEHALAVTSNNAVAHYFVGLASREDGQQNLAMAHFRDAVKADPSFAYAHYELGLCLEDAGKNQEAAEEHLAAAQAMPWLDWIHNHLGTVLWGLGRREEARAQFAETIRWQPDNDEAHYNLGLILADGGDFAGAAQQFAAVVRLKPEDGEARHSLAEALLKLGKADEALGHLETAVRVQPKEARFWGTLAEVYASAGRYADAVSAAGTARDLALAAGQKELAQALDARLASYRQQQDTPRPRPR